MRQLIANAIMRGDKEFNGVALPSPQTSGTYTQRMMYAKMEADKVIEKL
jgi:hypothetical protein